MLYVRTGKGTPWHLLAPGQDAEHTLESIKTLCGRSFQAMLCQSAFEIPKSGKVCKQCESQKVINLPDTLGELQEELTSIKSQKEGIVKEISELRSSLSSLNGFLETLKRSQEFFRKLKQLVTDLQAETSDSTTLYSFLSSSSHLRVSGDRLLALKGQIVKYNGELIEAKQVLSRTCPKCGKKHSLILKLWRSIHVSEPYSEEDSTEIWSLDLLVACCLKGGVIKIASSLSVCSRDFSNPIYNDGQEIEAYDYSHLLAFPKFRCPS